MGLRHLCRQENSSKIPEMDCKMVVEDLEKREHNWVMHSQHYPAIDGVEIINI